MLPKNQFMKFIHSMLAAAGLVTLSHGQPVQPSGETKNPNVRHSAAPGAKVAGPKLTPTSEIESRIRAARPMLGGPIPADLAKRLGVTHYDGRYHFTDKPYLVEGAEKIHELGMGVAKFWLHEDDLPGYRYNSNWGIRFDQRLVDVLKHPFYVEALAVPFSTICLEVFPLTGSKTTFFDTESNYKNEEEQFHEVAAYLLKTYAARDVTFVLQNWEGDWLFRHNDRTTWEKTPVDVVERRAVLFARFLAARQRGVERARSENPTAKCRVLHCAEVNRVLDATRGIATVMSHVLPHVAVDLVSWSCYDGLSNPTQLWQGIELIRHYMQPSPALGGKPVFIGEIGEPENLPGKTEAAAVDLWDRSMAVCFALDVPWIVHWELFCNEPNDGTKPDRRVRKAEELKGFWYVRPDGSLGWGGAYLDSLLKHAGGKLPAASLKKK
jgi:hypothetical protein